MDEHGERLEWRSLAVAAVVVAAGALMGFGGFALEQLRATWRPVITEAATGWHIRQPSLGINEPALAGGRLAWQAGAYTVMTDLGSGRSRLLGAAGSPRAVWPPAISSRYVVWQEVAGQAHQQTTVFSYDVASGRRQRRTTPSLESDPTVAGGTAYWAAIAGPALDTIVACDLRTGRQRVLGRVSHFSGWVVADDEFVVWSRQPVPQGQFTLTVLDLTTDTRHDLSLPGQTGGSTFDEPVLANGVLVWLRTDPTGPSTIEAYDLRTLLARQLATGTGLTAPSSDGTTVVWAAPAGSGGGGVVLGRRLAGGPTVTIAHVPAPVQSVMVSGRTVAWWAGKGTDSWIGTGALPR